jgi:hypothetical protein
VIAALPERGRRLGDSVNACLSFIPRPAPIGLKGGGFVVNSHLRLRIEATMRQWQPLMPHPFTVEGFCANLGRERRRPVRLIPWSAGRSDAPSGLWVATVQADYIFFDALATGLHRGHIVLHELGHVLLGHHDGVLDGQEIPFGVDSALVLAMAGRTRSYDEREELEAELFATYVGEWTARRQPDVIGEGARAELVIDRLSAALAGDRPWRR